VEPHAAPHDLRPTARSATFDGMEGSAFDEATFFGAVARIGARALPPAVAALVEAPRPVEEFLARVRAPLTEDEFTTAHELVTWFTRRYPTVRARLDYVRRAYARWARPLSSLPTPGSGI
jgi:hypothetical protein